MSKKVKDKLDHQWEEINPVTAYKYLETMNGNRSVRQTRVDFYASQMKAGLWRPTHQGIAFDKEDRLVDGQHRMWAIIEAAVPVTMMVTRGLSPEDVVTLDTTLGRDYRDIAHYQGWEPTDPMGAGVAKQIVLGPGNRNRMIPAAVLHGWYEAYKEGIDFALALRNSAIPRPGKRFTLSMTVAFARARYCVDPSVLTRMGEIIKSGQYVAEADRAAFTLREAWLQGALGTGHTEQQMKAEAAIRAFIDRRPIKKLQPAEKEVFSVPRLPKEKAYDAVTARRDAGKLSAKVARNKEEV